MFEKVDPQYLLAGVDGFIQEEVSYNLFYLITGFEEALTIKSRDSKVLFAQSPRGNPWLWVNRDLPEEERENALKLLIEYLDETSLTGVSSEPRTAEMFANLYGARYHTNIKRRMDMEAYACPQVVKPEGVSGCLRSAQLGDVETVAQYLAGFSEDGYGIVVDPTSQMEAAEMTVRKGGLYMWLVDDRPVSMAQIAHRSLRHGRINAVFTPRNERRKGYAGAVVSGLCSILLGEGLVPMLYADMVNPASNRAYQKIGFIQSGQISDIRFE